MSNVKRKNRTTSISHKPNLLASKAFLIILSCCLIAASLFIWKIQNTKLISQLYFQTESQSISISREAELNYRNIYKALTRLSNTGAPTNLQSVTEWKNNAAFYLESFPGIKGIAWVNTEMSVQIAEPNYGDTITIDQKFSDIAQKKSEEYLWIPVYKSTELEGFVFGIVDINQLFSPLTENLQNDYMLHITKLGETVLTLGNWKNLDNRLTINQKINLNDTEVLTLTISPTGKYRKSVTDSSRISFFLSLLISLITVFAIYFAQKNYSLSRLNVYQFRELLEKVDLVAATLDREARIIFFNDYFLKITGYTREQVMGKNWYTLLAPATPELDRKNFLDELANDNLGPHGEIQIQTKAGEPRFLAINNTILRNTNGEVVGVASIGEDITERKRNEDALLLQSAALSAAADAIVITDISGTIEWVNPAFCTLTGYEQEQIIGKNLRILVKSGNHDKKFYKDLWYTILSGEVWRGEIINKRKDNSLYTEYLTITPVRNAQNNIKHFIAIKRDISLQKTLEAENKKLAEQFYQTQRLDSIGKLAGGIAHDFNNLLVPILGYAEMGMMETEQDKNIHTHFEHIQEAGTRAANLTRQILAFSRQQLLELRTLDLNQVISEFQKMLQRLIGEDIKLTTKLEKNLHMIKGDKSQLEQVLLNLSINARDAMPKGGNLIIESANVTLSESNTVNSLELTSGSYIVLTVTDSGYGMDIKTQQRIFEPFFTSKSRDKGTGLGLSTVFGIVKQHSGSIQVTSEPGNGTTFKIYFPQTEAPVFIDKTTDQNKNQLLGSETILVVEDDSNVRQLVYETLHSKGYNVLVAEEPAVGLVQVDMYQEKIHLLLTDVILPQMSGPELYKQLVIIRPDLKVLYMSGYTDNKILQEGVLKKNVAYLQKPFSIDGLLRKVRSALEL
jgi:PAS domain S-box-containing protein